MNAAPLRAQLFDMRAALIEKLGQRIDGGALALLGSVGAAIAALDDDLAVEPAAGRAILADDGQAIRLAIVGQAGEAAAAELSPASAITLAGRLIGAARRRLAASAD
jgi:hypothetical protein